MSTNHKITFENLPYAVSLLLNEVRELKSLVDARNTIGNERVLIGIKEASEILCKKIPTVYRLVQKRSIPCYKQGKKLYFYKDELVACIEKGKVQSKLN